MWKKSKFIFQNKYKQKFDFYFQEVSDSNWHYQNKTYNKIFIIKISSVFGSNLFSICFDDDKFPSRSYCKQFLLDLNIPYNYFIPYLSEDVSTGINFSIIQIHKDTDFIILPRTH